MTVVWVVLMVASLAKMIVDSPVGVLTVMTDSVTQSVELCIKLAGAYCIWLGFIEIMRGLGILSAISVLLRPITRRLFGVVSPVAEEYLSVNMSANLIGVANASTPTAVKATEEMAKGKSKLTKGMAILFLINSSGLELLPSTVMGLRASAGSSSPADIFMPCLIVTVVTTALSVFFGWAFFGNGEDKKTKKADTCNFFGVVKSKKKVVGQSANRVAGKSGL